MMGIVSAKPDTSSLGFGVGRSKQLQRWRLASIWAPVYNPELSKTCVLCIFLMFLGYNGC